MSCVVKDENTAYLNLLNRKKELEKSLKDKCRELEEICIAEIDLTGMVPVELAVAAAENGVQKNRTRTMALTTLPLPEELLTKLKAKKLQVTGKARHKLSPKPKRPYPWSNEGSPSKMSQLSVTSDNSSQSSSSSLKSSRSYTTLLGKKLFMRKK